VSTKPFGQVAHELGQAVRETQQLLREEHFPYDGGLRAYEALHAVLVVLADDAQSFVKWAALFSDGELEAEHMARFRVLVRIHQTIKEKLG
jgi:hypothetical protein